MSNIRYSKNDYVKSSPHFFRLILLAMIIFTVVDLCLAILISAPLMGPADTGAPPNPARSAWFLLWIQELVSHGNYLAYPAMLIAALFVFLPWIPVYRPVWRATWFPCGQLAVNIAVIAIFIIIVVLTFIGAFFRGAEWQFTLPF